MSVKKFSLKWGKRAGKLAVLALALNAFTIPFTYLINRNVSYEKKTIVFTSGKNDFQDYKIPEIPSPVTASLIDFFMYTPITLRQNLKGNSVYWCSNPSLDEFVEKLQNPEFENVILIGHGRKNSYALKDNSADASYLKSISLPDRTGEFHQYTCGIGEEDGETLKDVIFSECTKSKRFDGILDPFTSYASAWEEFSDLGE